MNLVLVTPTDIWLSILFEWIEGIECLINFDTAVCNRLSRTKYLECLQRKSQLDSPAMSATFTSLRKLDKYSIWSSSRSFDLDTIYLTMQIPKMFDWSIVQNAKVLIIHDGIHIVDEQRIYIADILKSLKRTKVLDIDFERMGVSNDKLCSIDQNFELKSISFNCCDPFFTDVHAPSFFPWLKQTYPKLIDLSLCIDCSHLPDNFQSNLFPLLSVLNSLALIFYSHVENDEDVTEAAIPPYKHIGIICSIEKLLLNAFPLHLVMDILTICSTSQLKTLHLPVHPMHSTVLERLVTQCIPKWTTLRKLTLMTNSYLANSVISPEQCTILLLAITKHCTQIVNLCVNVENFEEEHLDILLNGVFLSHLESIELALEAEEDDEMNDENPDEADDENPEEVEETDDENPEEVEETDDEVIIPQSGLDRLCAKLCSNEVNTLQKIHFEGKVNLESIKKLLSRHSKSVTSLSLVGVKFIQAKRVLTCGLYLPQLIYLHLSPGDPDRDSVVEFPTVMKKKLKKFLPSFAPPSVEFFSDDEMNIFENFEEIVVDDDDDDDDDEA